MPETRIPPFSIDAEQATLGGLLVDPDGFVKIKSSLAADDFYEPRHRLIFGAMMVLYESGKPVDLLTVSQALKDSGQLDKVGGTGYLMDLTSASPTSANIAYYSEIVIEKSILRRVIDTGGGIAKLAYEEGAKADEVLDEAEKAIFGIASSNSKTGFVQIKDVLSPVFNRIEEINKNKSGITGVPTGYYDLDKMTAGFQKSDLIILAARPSVGKSSLGLNIACNVAMREKKTVAIFSLEMSKESLVERMMASEARVNAQDMRRGTLSDDAWPKISHCIGELYNAPIYVDDTPELSALELRAKARKLALEKGLSLIIVDYLQLMHTKMKVENRVQEISQITRSLKALARELSVPIIVQSQLSRTIEQRQDHRPVLSDLRESGSIEQDADVVMFLSRPQNEKESQLGLIDLILAKQRNGPVGNIKLKFMRQYTRFENVTSAGGDESMPDVDF
jgi:replicative DNA helicase